MDMKIDYTLVITDNATTNIPVQVFVWTCFWLSTNKGVSLLGHMVILRFTHSGTAELFPTVAPHFTFPPVMYDRSLSTHTRQHYEK